MISSGQKYTIKHKVNPLIGDTYLQIYSTETKLKFEIEYCGYHK